MSQKLISMYVRRFRPPPGRHHRCLVFLLLCGVACGCVISSGKEVQLPGHYTRGEYARRIWHIDDDHLVHWDVRPDIRYGFSGSPSLQQLEDFIEFGIDQFNVGASEKGFVFAEDPELQQENADATEAYTQRVTELGGTYYARLNTLLPWKGSGKIPDAARVPWLERSVTDVAEYGGTSAVVSVTIPVPEDLSGHTLSEAIEILLLDGGTASATDLSDRVTSVSWSDPGGEGEDIGHEITVELDEVEFPASDSLFISAAVPTSRETVSGLEIPAMWNRKVKAYYQDALLLYADAYQKTGLRGLCFCGDIAPSEATPFARSMEDFGRDESVLNAYRDWIAGVYDDDIADLNADLGETFSSFDEVPWYTRPLPYESLDQVEEGRELFGLYSSVKAVKKIYRLQNDFRYDFYGSWYARYADMAREVIGETPVFIAAGAAPDVGSRAYDIHGRAMVHGVDGLARSSFGELSASERLGTITIGGQDLGGIRTFVEEISGEAGKTKAYIAHEFYWIEESGDPGQEDGVDPVFEFPSKGRMKAFLETMIDHGYAGFHLLVDNPGQIWAHEGDDENKLSTKRDMERFIELKEDIVQYLLQR